jgi:hypothetical protein
MALSDSLAVAGTLLACGLLSCGGPVTAVEQAPVAETEPAEQRSQDQQILLDPVLVHSLDAARPQAPHSIPGELHVAEQLALIAQAGGQDALACLEVGAEPTGAELGGEVVVSLEIDDGGQVLGGATTPAGGEEGLAAVADCLLSRARTWEFPSRSLPGHTVLVVPYQFGRSAR